VFANGDVLEPLSSRNAGRTTRNPAPRHRLAGSQILRFARHFAARTAAPAALQGGVAAGVKVSLVTARTGEQQTWQYDQGLRGYLLESLAQSSHADPLIRCSKASNTPAADAEGFAEGEGAALGRRLDRRRRVVRESYVNLIPTSAGGTHESGLRDGLFGAVKSFVEMHSLLPKGVKLLPEDVFARVSFVLSAKVLDPQFQGQIKERLNSRDAVRLVSGYCRPALELWLNQHVEYGKKLADLASSRRRAGCARRRKSKRKNRRAWPCCPAS